MKSIHGNNEYGILQIIANTLFIFIYLFGDEHRYRSVNVMYLANIFYLIFVVRNGWFSIINAIRALKDLKGLWSNPNYDFFVLLNFMLMYFMFFQVLPDTSSLPLEIQIGGVVGVLLVTLISTIVKSVYKRSSN